MTDVHDKATRFYIMSKIYINFFHICLITIVTYEPSLLFLINSEFFKCIIK